MEGNSDTAFNVGIRKYGLAVSNIFDYFEMLIVKHLLVPVLRRLASIEQETSRSNQHDTIGNAICGIHE